MSLNNPSKICHIQIFSLPLHSLFRQRPCPDGGIGRRAGLKHQWGNPSRFEPGSGYKDRLITCWLSAYFVFMGSQRVGKDNHISLFDTYIRLKKGVQVYHYTNTPIKNIVGFSKAVTKIQK